MLGCDWSPCGPEPESDGKHPHTCLNEKEEPGGGFLSGEEREGTDDEQRGDERAIQHDTHFRKVVAGDAKPFDEHGGFA